ncbi:sirohydrochlorin chelatase [Actinokineospora sp.]|uniref:sirohydrochlorin chelatase n=1 Tax=Actinokineospora sp. TaxID=1872133 RepID=UPI004038052C
MVLVAHGTRSDAGVRSTHTLADEVRELLPEVPVKVAFADVRAPDVTTVLRSVRGHAVVVPAFLASGYHVRVDVPGQVAAAECPYETVITAALGPAPALVAAMHDRLAEAGWRPGDAVVLAAAGSSDHHAHADIRRAALLLGARTGSVVRIGYAATSSPAIRDVVAEVRRDATRIAVASWLLAPGRFHTIVADCGADVIAAPLGPHPRIADLIVRRYTEARIHRAAA